MTLLLLFGCYDFEGDEGRIGFVSDLQTTSGTKWTPESGIVGGTSPSFMAVIDLTVEDQELGEVWGDADFEHSADEAYWLKVEGPQRGRGEVFFDGALSDGFELRFRPADEVVLSDLAEEQLDDFAMVQGGEAALKVEVRDRWSRPLGYRAEDLVVEADGGLSAWMEDGYLRVIADGPGGLRVEVGQAEYFADIRLGEVHEERIVRLAEDDESAFLLHRAWTADGTALFGAPAKWPEGAVEQAPGVATLVTTP